MNGRSALHELLCRPSHAGLWLDRFLCYDSEQEDAAAKAECIRKACEAKIPEGYTSAFDLRAEDFGVAARAGRAKLAEATVRGRLVVGLGARGVLEAGLRLDRTWGVPILPGSALKGLAATAAHQLACDPEGVPGGWQKPSGWPQAKAHSPATPYEELFGTTTNGGAIVFHDAWWKPTNTCPLLPDVMTVHHPEYYQGGKPTAPSDFDSPTPIPFLSVAGTFLVVIEGHPLQVADGYALLSEGLRVLGLGAKTSSGYGRMDLRDAEDYLERARRAASSGGSPKSRFEGALAELSRARELGCSSEDLCEAIQTLKGALSSSWADLHRPDWLRELDQRAVVAVPLSPVVSEPEAWVPAQGWTVMVKGRREFRLRVTGAAKIYAEKEQVFKDEPALIERLRDASESTPLELEVSWRAGAKRIKRIRPRS
jgi:CRISPR-associated protein Cmr6